MKKTKGPTTNGKNVVSLKEQLVEIVNSPPSKMTLKALFDELASMTSENRGWRDEYQNPLKKTKLEVLREKREEIEKELDRHPRLVAARKAVDKEEKRNREILRKARERVGIARRKFYASGVTEALVREVKALIKEVETARGIL